MKEGNSDERAKHEGTKISSQVQAVEEEGRKLRSVEEKEDASVVDSFVYSEGATGEEGDCGEDYILASRWVVAGVVHSFKGNCFGRDRIN